MSGAARLLLHVSPWIPLGFLMEAFLAQILFLTAGSRAARRERSRKSRRG